MDNGDKLALLKAACIRGRLDFDALIQECREGRSQFWEVEDACAVTSVVSSGNLTVCHIVVLGGTRAGMTSLAPLIETFARNNFCDYIRATGRIGFEKIHDDIFPGYRPAGVVFEKQIWKEDEYGRV